MAIPSYSAEEVLRIHYGELLVVLNALSDPVTIAGNLFAKHIITDNTLQEVQVTGQTVSKKNQIILEAVRNTVKSKQGRLLEFMNVLTTLDRLSLTDNLVTKMRSELSEFLDTDRCMCIEWEPYKPGSTGLLGVLILEVCL